MSISSASVPFTEALIAAAPQSPGVFALWQGGGIVYYGRAIAIRAFDAERRQRELMSECLAAHQRMPLWNDPQRLPTA